jgi:hypothetical protein
VARADAEALIPRDRGAPTPIARAHQRERDVLLIRAHRVSSFRGLPLLPLCRTV